MHFLKIFSGAINDGSNIFTEKKDVGQNTVPRQTYLPKITFIFNIFVEILFDVCTFKNYSAIYNFSKPQPIEQRKHE